jgi:undecaprenyl-diphosphatase
MDRALLHALNGFASNHDGFEDALSLYETLGQLLFVALLGGLLLAGGPLLRRGAVVAGLAAGIALAWAQLLARVVERPRPFVADPAGVHLFAAHAADPGFPSDHATAAFAIAVALLLRDRRWGAAALALASGLAVGRVAIGVHYPSDVLAGAALGAAVALLLHVRAARERIDRVADRAGAVIAILRGAVATGVRVEHTTGKRRSTS